MAFIGVVFKGILDYKDLPFYHHFDAITLVTVICAHICRIHRDILKTVVMVYAGEQDGKI